LAKFGFKLKNSQITDLARDLLDQLLPASHLIEKVSSYCKVMSLILCLFFLLLLCSTETKTLWSFMLNYDYECEKKNNKFKFTFSSSETDDEEIKKFPNKVIKLRVKSMETQPQNGEDG
jgi:hypothetical protein